MTQQQVSFKMNTTFMLPLTAVSCADVQRVGNKAANLGELLRAGFPVPEGMVLTTTAFQRFLVANGLDATSGLETVKKASIPSDIRDQLSQVIDRFRNTLLVVRSSSIAEDLPDASFAGQYTTILNVRGLDALTSAVKKCWTSAFSDHATKYRVTKGKTKKVDMAILIQTLISADAAGVAFSANPVTGDRQECVINAIHGIGERLVSGQATPDEWIIRGKEIIRHIVAEDAISAEEAQIIAELASRVETYFGTPQDVEWALKDGYLFLLQARPITTLPAPSTPLIPISINPPPGFWERDNAHFSDPITPMLRSAILPIHESAMCRSMEENSMLIEGFEYREIGGWFYARVIPLGGKARSPPPQWLMPLLIRLSPTLRRRIKGLVHMVRTDKLLKDVERWNTTWKPNTIKRIHELNKVNVTSLSDSQLLQHLKTVHTFVADCIYIHALVTAVDLLVAELVLTCQDLLGWDARKSLTLLSGLSSQTTEPTSALFDLVQHAQKSLGICQLLDHIDQNTPNRLTTVDADFAAIFENYLQRFGHRTLRWDLDQETLKERPELVLKMIRDQIVCNYDFTAEAKILEAQRTQILAEARHALTTYSSRDQSKFEDTLARAIRAYPIREEHEFYLSNVPFALFRYALLEVGRRLVEHGKLAQPNDIFFLEFDDAINTFQEDLDRRILVNQRKGERAWAQTNPGPAFYGEPPPPPPSITAFPPEARNAMRAMNWLVEGLFASQSRQYTKTGIHESIITGLPASPGHYTGPVRVIHNETEFGKLRVGDVLVCQTTQPPWAVLFPSVGALVTDGGGILSHPAIVAREYHIPAVVATGNATHLLRDGQVVTVDGDSGSVEITVSVK